MYETLGFRVILCRTAETWRSDNHHKMDGWNVLMIDGIMGGDTPKCHAVNVDVDASCPINERWRRVASATDGT